jgi:hypothetical protein
MQAIQPKRITSEPIVCNKPTHHSADQNTKRNHTAPRIGAARSIADSRTQPAVGRSWGGAQIIKI